MTALALWIGGWCVSTYDDSLLCWLSWYGMWLLIDVPIIIFFVIVVPIMAIIKGNKSEKNQ